MRAKAHPSKEEFFGLNKAILPEGGESPFRKQKE